MRAGKASTTLNGWIGLAWFIGCIGMRCIAAGPATAAVTFATPNGSIHALRLEVAASEAERQQGLMYRTSLPDAGGMIFLYDAPTVAAMWMKDTFIPLDMIFVSEQGEVVYIARNTTPYSLTPITANVPVTAVIELAGGSCDRLGVRLGDHVDYHITAVTSDSSAPH